MSAQRTTMELCGRRHPVTQNAEYLEANGGGLRSLHQSVFRRASAMSAPKTNPATCAIHAMPEFSEMPNCEMNQKPNSNQAGTVIGNTNKSESTGARGNHMRYA